MGQYADDLINGSIEADGMTDFQNESWINEDYDFEVSITHRRTFKIELTGIVTASSKKDAQKEFRKKYAHIRSQYTHEYGLLIKRLNR